MNKIEQTLIFRQRFAADKRILELVKPFGFSGLEYNGLAPTLIKDKRDVRIPF